MNALPRIQIIEEYLQYQASRGCYAPTTLNGWRLVLGQVFRENEGQYGLTSVTLDELDLGIVSTTTRSERCRVVQGFRDWYYTRKQSGGVLA